MLSIHAISLSYFNFDQLHLFSVSLSFCGPRTVVSEPRAKLIQAKDTVSTSLNHGKMSFEYVTVPDLCFGDACFNLSQSFSFLNT